MEKITLEQFRQWANAKGKDCVQKHRQAAGNGIAMLLAEYEKAFDTIRKERLFLIPDFWGVKLEDVLPKLNSEQETRLRGLFELFQINRFLKESISEFLKYFNENGFSQQEFLIGSWKVFEIGRLNKHFPKITSPFDKEPQERKLFYSYDGLSAQALHRIIKLLPKHEPGSDVRKGSYEFMLNMDRWIGIVKDQIMFEDFVDAYSHGGFEFDFEKRKDVEVVVLKAGSAEVAKRTKRNAIKEQFRKEHYHYLSESGVSEDEYFQEVDPKFKTAEGLVSLYVSPGVTVTSQSQEGTTWMELPEEYWDLDDPDRSSSMALAIFMESQFNYSLRQNLQKSYWLSDETDTSRLILDLPNGEKVTLSKAMLAISFFAAQTSNIEYLRNFLWDHDRIGRKFLDEAMKGEGLDTPNHDLLQKVNDDLANLRIELEKEKNPRLMPGYMALKEDILIDRLMALTKLNKEQVQGILELLVTQDFGLSPLVRSNEEYHWYPQDFIYHDVPQYFYSYFWRMKQYGGRKNKGKMEKAATRARLVAEYLSDLFKEAGHKFALAEVMFRQVDMPKKRRDIDVLVYDEKTNVALTIEIKLANTPQDNYFKRNRWKASRIDKKALEQVAMAKALLVDEKGGEWLQETFQLAKAPSDFEVKQLIVVDNFFFDHERFDLKNSGKDSVIVVSVFELQLLLRGNDLLKPGSSAWAINELARLDNIETAQIPDEFLKWIHEETKVSLNTVEGQKFLDKVTAFLEKNKAQSREQSGNLSIPRLMEIIEKNQLWGFIERGLEKYNIKKSLRMFQGFEYSLEV